jgi:hypothetical protein
MVNLQQAIVSVASSRVERGKPIKSVARYSGYISYTTCVEFAIDRKRRRRMDL